jgi:hypothetical protein
LSGAATSVRRALGTTLLVAAAAWPLAGTTGRLQIVEEQVRPTSSGADVVRVTRPPGPKEIAPLLLVGLLLWIPDFAAIELTGLFKIRRELEQTAERQHHAAERLDRIETAVQAQQQITVNNILGDSERFLAGIRQKAASLHDESGHEAFNGSVHRRWDALQRRATDYEASGRNVAVAVQRWRTVFADDLAIVAAALDADRQDHPGQAESTLQGLAALEKHLEQAAAAADNGL